MKHKKKRHSSRFLSCPGTELNRYDRCGSQDFKSCVSTNSTTGALESRVHSQESGVSQKKSSAWLARGCLRAEDRARTGHPDLGKVVLYQMSYFRIFYYMIKNLKGGKNKALPFSGKMIFNCRLFVLGSI